MTREEAREYLINISYQIGTIGIEYLSCRDGDKMRQAIKVLALEEQHWIPVAERLPDTNRDVLLQFSKSMGVGFWEHNSWGINTGDNIYSEIGEREAQPIAWRELPEPYGGEQNEQSK